MQPPGPGWWLAADGRWYPPQGWSPQQPQYGAPPPRKSGGNSWIIVVVVIVVVVLAGAGTAVWFFVSATTKVIGGGLALGTGAGASCPSASDISGIVGKQLTGPQSMTLVGSTGCVYKAGAGESRLDVNLVIGPEFLADEKLREFADEGRAAQVEPESISVGRRGQAWTYPTKSAATAVGGGHLVLVEIMTSQQAPGGDKKDAAVAILRKVIG
jgi:hypothetical protein